MEDVQSLNATLAKNGDKVRERVREVADTALEKGRDTWKNLRDQGKEAMVGAQKSAKEAWEDAQKLLQKHPGKAVGLAFFIGAVMGGVLIAMRNRE